ncbi:MAG: hypothetical protein R2800_08425 [Flavipsychrobacter sp.]
MVYPKVQNRAIAFLVASLLSVVCAKAQAPDASNISSRILDRLYSIDGDTPSRSANYVIITDRNCYSCFDKLCDYFSTTNTESAEVNAIVIMEKAYQYLLSTRARHKEGIKCVNKIYFLFKEDCKEEDLKSISQAPSPQLVKLSNGKLVYHTYYLTEQMMNASLAVNASQ